MIQSVTCICCPLGCPLSVELNTSGEVVSVTGHSCKRGETYGRKEATAPERVLTFTLPVEGRLEPLSVKTTAPIPKSAMFCAIDQLRQAQVAPPVCIGEVVLTNLAGTGVSVVATKTVE